MRIDASCGTQTKAGKFLGFLYYDTPALKLFRHEELRGSPDDGGSHSLIITAAKADIEAFLDLIEMRYSSKTGCEDFVARVRNQLS